MTKALRSRARFLMELVADFNDQHEDYKAVFRLDYDTVDVFVEDTNRIDKMIEFVRFDELTEEKVYEIYKQMFNFKEEKSTADDDAPKMDVTEE